MEGQAEPAVADPQLQSLGLRVELRRQQQPVRVPRPELEAGGEPPGGGRRRRRQRQEAAAGAQEGAGHQLGLRAREGHVALEDDRSAKGQGILCTRPPDGASGLLPLHWSHVCVGMTGGGEKRRRRLEGDWMKHPSV